MNIVSGGLSAILYGNNNYVVVDGETSFYIDWFVNIDCIADGAFQNVIIYNINVGTQLTFGCFLRDVGGASGFVSEAMSLDVRASSGIAEPISSFDRAFHVSRGILHLLQLSLHNVLLTEQNKSGYGRYYESRYVQPEPTPLPRDTVIVLALLLISISLLLIVYSLKRGDYLLVIGALVQFIPLALGLELLLYNGCLPFFVSLYSAFPICRYAIP